MEKIYPVLLAGGSGVRLWPLSRKSYPKQFSSLIGDKTLFQQAALRLTSSEFINFAPPVTLTNSDFRFTIKDQLQNVGIDQADIIIEPEPKNTAPAILAASLFLIKKNPEAILLVTPSDHIIPDKLAFHRSIKLGLEQVNNNKIVTFGVTPTHPETGYGYLELGLSTKNKDNTYSVNEFIEKPEYKNALNMFNSGNYLWNAGIFLFKAKEMITSFRNISSKNYALTKKSLENAKFDLSFLRLNKDYWKDLKSISIDYAIMEKAKNLVAVAITEKWSDLGSWDSVWSESDKDEFGVSLSNNAHAIECSNTIIRSENNSQQIIGLGLDNIIAVAMPDAVLVANKDKAQEVKKAVDHLKAKNINQAENFPKNHRPWGWFESLAKGEQFQVKRICVKSGGALSLQSHQYRSEHWIVVQGHAKVTVNNTVKNLKEGQSTYVPQGAIHRLENKGKIPIILIEVQIGTYFGEDDIVRYEDLYERF